MVINENIPSAHEISILLSPGSKYLKDSRRAQAFNVAAKAFSGLNQKTFKNI